jgi:putative restriction endonuclease
VPRPDVDEDDIRAAACEWLQARTQDGQVPISREALANEFLWRGERFPLIDRGRGIRRPIGWRSALSITTAVAKSGGVRPYEDDVGADGLQRYKLRRDVRGQSENDGLHHAMQDQEPLIWFYGEAPGVFRALVPIFLIEFEAMYDRFVIATVPEAPGLLANSSLENAMRRYVFSETRKRLHQPIFASLVMQAYRTRCAICSLARRELLDASHIVPDSAPNGEPIVSNGLALCKIHHAAYDSDILGIRPDLIVEVREDLLNEIDGPMLRHGIQAHHGQRLMRLPAANRDQPDPERLEWRYSRFRAA